MRRRDTRITVEMSPDLKATLEAMAREDGGCSVASVVRRIIDKAALGSAQQCRREHPEGFLKRNGPCRGCTGRVATERNADDQSTAIS
jgi:hypothetical protein